MIGGVSRLAISTFTQFTLEGIVEDMDKVTKQTGPVVQRSVNLAAQIAYYYYYYSSISIVGAMGVSLWSNISESVSGDGEFNYWHIPLIVTNALSLTHELLRNNASYDTFFQKRVENPMKAILG